MTRRLIEHWLPIAEISIESTRERTPMTPFPAPNRLHVWWARRPLVASRAAIAASLLPADADRKKFLHLLGILGDPMEAKKKMAEAVRQGIRVSDPYGYSRAFSYTPSQEEKDWLKTAMKELGISTAAVLDPTAGGGSIPFEAIRLGLNSFGNDLNPVASFIEKMTIEAPFSNGLAILKEFQRISKNWRNRIEKLQGEYFPQLNAPQQYDTTYLLARTMHCPYCGGLIPLSPTWNLSKDGIGVRLIPADTTEEKDRICSFEIVSSAAEQSLPTVKGGRATCPWHDCGRVVEGDQVKAFAQEHGLGEQIYAVVYKKRVDRVSEKTGKPLASKWERGYRAACPEDNVMDNIKARVDDLLPEWEAQDLVPTEFFPEICTDDRPRQYGMPRWIDLFSPRQLYCHVTGVKVFRELLQEEQAKKHFGDVQKAAFGYLCTVLDTMLNYGTRLCHWDTKTERVRSIFDRHDFAFVWSYSEMAPCITGLGYDWAIEKTEKCLQELTQYLKPGSKDGEGSLMVSCSDKAMPELPKIQLSCGSGDSLPHIADQSIDAVVMDPPYYDNVMYAELSDFFYVWLKKTAGYVYPELFTRILTDKENEAVANPSLFKDEEHPKECAGKAYKDRMAAIFAECRRVLKTDGVLMLMFTHKATGAWDALAKGLLDAGFMITASWPVNTEAEGSLHIRDKAAANSTIFLVCRPRPPKDSGEIVFWEDLEPKVREEVTKHIESFRNSGISGIDLYLACFGPALEVFSRHWPVSRSMPRTPKKTMSKNLSLLDEPQEDLYAATPEDVLETARSAVKNWTIQDILKLQRPVSLDPITSWFVLAWNTFRAPVFPFDEALNLARVTGVDMSKDIIGSIAGRKASDVVLWDSETRAASASLGSASGSRSMLDALHHAVHTARTYSLQQAKDNLHSLGLDNNLDFMDALRAVLEVLPISHTFSHIPVQKALEASASDFEILEKLRMLVFSEQIPRPIQLDLLEKK